MSEVLVIGEAGQKLGVMSRDEALKAARERGLDLILISPTARPPVARIINFDKFRYEQVKKLKQQRLHQKGGELKQVQISVRAALHDLELKAKKTNEFLAEGNTVEILMRLRGREKAHKDFAREKLAAFLKIISPEHAVVMEPRQSMRGISVQVTKR